ncbi:MAG: GH92 family glycosyl hydrolase, partial [Nocardiopsaceae bacterium]|nr:GH92 family glycosyl hydrolase [Nocardiopsaceae bacterium]
ATGTGAGTASVPADLGTPAGLSSYVSPLWMTSGGCSTPDFPLSGSGAYGLAQPGPTAPFGMVQLSPDQLLSQRGYDETLTSTYIRGFSHTHSSGFPNASGGHFPMLPTVGGVTTTDPSQYGSDFSRDSEQAALGYYAVRLARYGIGVELTATERTGWHRYTFPASEAGTVLIDVGQGLGNYVADASITIVGDNQAEGFATVMVHGNYGNSNIVTPMTLFFSAAFDQAFASFGTWNSSTVVAGSRQASGGGVGGYVSFGASGPSVVVAKVGVSFVSIDGARANLAAEAPDFDFDAARARTVSAWNEVLGRVQVSGSDANRAKFYTALYNACRHPSIYSDVDGRYPGFDGAVHTAAGRVQYEMFSLWDTCRAQVAMLGLLLPERCHDMVASMLSRCQQGGWVPYWTLAGHERNIMRGEGISQYWADAFVKGLFAGTDGTAGSGGGEINAEEAYQALRRNATELPPADGETDGRVGIGEYISLGYVPYDAKDTWLSVSASLTLEYAANDAALAVMAQILGHASDAAMFRSRARNYRNLYDQGSGFIRPRLADGSWLSPFKDPSLYSSGRQDAYTSTISMFTTGYTEGNAWTYLWDVPQDVPGLAGLMGGTAAAASRLDQHFAYDSVVADPGQARLLWGYGNPARFEYYNEPGYQVPWTYAWLGQPWKTQAMVRILQDQVWTTGPGEFPGNDDAGGTSAWFVLSALGMYAPMPGTGVWTLNTPLFDEVVVRLTAPYYQAGTFTVSAPGAEGNPWIQSAALNGQGWDSAWIGHDAIRRGARLSYRLGSTPNTGWASAPGAAPPTSAGSRGSG